MGGKFDEYDWAELPPDAKVAAENLGYTQTKWDKGHKMPFYELGWEEMTKEQQVFLGVLGYSQESWDGSGAVEPELFCCGMLSGE